MTFLKDFQKCTWLAILLSILFINGCVHLEYSHVGTVTDADTLEPMNNVVVYTHLKYECILPPNPGGNSPKPLGDVVTGTDNAGKFHLPFSFFMRPPLLCQVMKEYTYFKPGYFQDTYNVFLGDPDYNDLQNPIKISLKKITHYLDFLPYLDSKNRIISNYNLPKKPLSYQTAFNKLKNMKLDPQDEKGIFVRLPGKRLTRIHFLPGVWYYNHDGTLNLQKNLYYVFDEKSQDWMIIDSTGRDVSTLKSKFKLLIPKQWEFYFGDMGIYADRDSIYYPKYSEKYGTSSPVIVEQGAPEDLGFNIKAAEQGAIEGLAGNGWSIITIERNGKTLGNYDYNYNFNHNLININMLTSADLPYSEKDNAVKSSTSFMFIASSGGGEVIIITKTDNFWHVYRMQKIGYNKPITGNQFTELGVISLDKEITGFTVNGRSLYIVFKNEGIKPCYFSNGNLVTDPTFDQFNKTLKGDIKSAILSYTYRFLPVLYVVSGDDRVFRLTLKGVLDYPIAISE